MERLLGFRAFVPFTLLTVLVWAVFVPSVRAQQSQTIFPAQIPERILAAKTISLSVFWPEGSWQERVEIEADAAAFLRKWKRFQVVEDHAIETDITSVIARQPVNPPVPDLIAIVVVEPIAWRSGGGRSFLAALFAGMQTLGAAHPIQTNCSGTETAIGDGMHANVSVDCQTYVPPVEQVPVAQPLWPSYVYGGSILVFDGPQFDHDIATRIMQGQWENDPAFKYVHFGPLPVSEPLLVALADDRGTEPLLTAAKRLRKAIDAAEKARKHERLVLPGDRDYEYLPPATEIVATPVRGQTYECERFAQYINALRCSDGNFYFGPPGIAPEPNLPPLLSTTAVRCSLDPEGMRCNDKQLYAGPYVQPVYGGGYEYRPRAQ